MATGYMQILAGTVFLLTMDFVTRTLGLVLRIKKME